MTRRLLVYAICTILVFLSAPPASMSSGEKTRPTKQGQMNGFFAKKGYRVVKVVRSAKITAYSRGDGHTPGGLTKCETKVGYGTVAVDPKVIKLRSHLYIKDYGFGRALDTGSGISGDEADIYLSTPKKAIEFGIQRKDIYVLKRI